MSGAPIVLTFYNQETHDVEKTFSQAFIPWRMMKKVAKLLKINLDPENLDEKTVDEISGLVVDVFCGRFTAEELENHTDLEEMVTVLQAIMTKVSGMLPDGNPTTQA
ncbi:hypothetical protein hrd7_25420 [Leptolinea sp. HRD-7]|nr:hypothetical protein hrd7_25420 [Leptolinea sp. HRD-7]